MSPLGHFLKLLPTSSAATCRSAHPSNGRQPELDGTEEVRSGLQVIDSGGVSVVDVVDDTWPSAPITPIRTTGEDPDHFGGFCA